VCALKVICTVPAHAILMAADYTTICTICRCASPLKQSRTQMYTDVHRCTQRMQGTQSDAGGAAPAKLGK
jgi:hypothetical protein